MKDETPGAATARYGASPDYPEEYNLHGNHRAIVHHGNRWKVKGKFHTLET